MTNEEMAEAVEYLADAVEDEWGSNFKFLDETREAIEQLRNEAQPLVAATFPVELPTGAVADGGIVHIPISGHLLQGKKAVRAIILEEKP